MLLEHRCHVATQNNIINALVVYNFVSAREATTGRLEARVKGRLLTWQSLTTGGKKYLSIKRYGKGLFQRVHRSKSFHTGSIPVNWKVLTPLSLWVSVMNTCDFLKKAKKHSTEKNGCFLHIIFLKIICNWQAADSQSLQTLSMSNLQCNRSTIWNELSC